MTDITNQSGGIDIDAESTTIGGDAVGRDKIINQNTHNYFAAPTAQPRRAELPHQPYFFGREEELAVIAEALDPESNGWGMLIDGPGGIGKKALAIRAGHLAPDSLYPTKIFLSAKIRELTPQGEQPLEDFMLPNYMALLAELARELGDEGIERIDLNERPKEVRRLLENSHALIIIDNLETFDERERERLFQFLRRLPRSCKAVVTSRRRTDVAAEIIRLDRLSAEATQKLIAKLAERNKYLARATKEERQQLYEITHGNPLLVEWIAGQLGRPESKCRTIADACQYLETTPRDNDPLEYVFGDLLDTITDHETAVLAALSHFTLPVESEWIAHVAGVAFLVTQTALEDLTDRSLLISDVQTHTFVLPPSVNTFLRRNRPEVITQTADRLTDRIFALVVENGRGNYQGFRTLDNGWAAIAAALPLFLQGDNDRLQRVCYALGTFLSYSGRWDEKLSLSLRAEGRAVASNDLANAGWQTYNAGAVYYSRGQSLELLSCAKRADQYWVNSGAYEKAYAKRLWGWWYRLENDYSASKEFFQDMLGLLRTVSPESSDVVFGLNSLAQVERSARDYSAAERDFLEALRIAEKINSRMQIADGIGNLAGLALDRQDLFSAEQLAREALPLCESIGRQESIASSCGILAEALMRQNRKTEGLPYALRAVEIYSRLHSRNLKWVQTVLEECGG